MLGRLGVITCVLICILQMQLTDAFNLQMCLSCPLVSNCTAPMECRPPRSSVHGISQARIQGLVAMPSPPGNLPNPGIEPRSPALQADSLPSEPLGKPTDVFIRMFCVEQR